MAKAQEPGGVRCRSRGRPPRGASRSPFQGRDGGTASVWWALEERTALRNVTRANLAERPYCEIRERWLASKWLDGGALVRASGRRKSTVYHNLGRLRRTGAVRTREVSRRDRRGIPRKVVEYQVAEAPAPIDPDLTDTWFEIDRRRYSMVDAWKPGSTWAVSGWTTLTTRQTFKIALRNARNLLILFWLSRESWRRGKGALDELYPRALEAGDDLRKEIDTVLDRIERGASITLVTKGVISGEHPEGFAFADPINVDPGQLAAELRRLEEHWAEVGAARESRP